MEAKEKEDKAGIVPDPLSVRLLAANKYKRLEQVPPWFTEIDCQRPGILGNPFKTGTREENIRAFEEYLRGECRVKTPVYEKILSLVGRIQAGEYLALMCTCKPLACHCDVLVRAILGYAKKGEKL